MGKVFAYARVSTPRQGERGVSLPEQRDAISRYAERQGLEIVRWFEEQESASKKGRPAFNQMLQLLRLGIAHGVVIHKIDRSARNLEDWNDIGKLVDAGVDVRFATESIDLKTTSGRLSADIQAVVATHYSRNLRDEVKKGLYGRLKQGFYPWRAPAGYLDQGAAKPKTPDPIQGPLVKSAFELYGNGTHSLPQLTREMFHQGLRNRKGGRVSLNGLSTILRNPFYVGLIRILKTGQTFKGSHEPLISVALFERVQAILSGKRVDRVQSHVYTYSRIARCATCKYSLIAEGHKGHVYYRCHNRPFKTPAVCQPTSVREEAIDEAVLGVLATVQLSENEIQAARAYLMERRKDSEEECNAMQTALRLQHDQVSNRISKLTDLLVEGTITKPLFQSKHRAMLLEQAGIDQKIENLKHGASYHLKQLETTVELAKDASILYRKASVENKRKLLKIVLSNIIISGKSVEIMLSVPFRLIAQREKCDDGRAYRGTCRTWSRLLEQFKAYLNNNPAALSGADIVKSD
jgi:DNA invertase Pin-like site-specific DNA recombinase